MTTRRTRLPVVPSTVPKSAGLVDMLTTSKMHAGHSALLDLSQVAPMANDAVVAGLAASLADSANSNASCVGRPQPQVKSAVNIVLGSLMSNERQALQRMWGARSKGKDEQNREVLDATQLADFMRALCGEVSAHLRLSAAQLLSRPLSRSPLFSPRALPLSLSARFSPVWHAAVCVSRRCGCCGRRSPRWTRST